MDAVGKTSIERLEDKGLGVVARAPIAAGELIEVARAVELSVHDCALIEQTPLADYYFAHPRNEYEGFIIFGSISVLNHASSPNTKIEWEHFGGSDWLVKLYALTRIEPATELTRTYRCEPWFHPVE